MELSRLTLDDLSPARVWTELDDQTRDLAARAVYGDSTWRREADAAVADAIRFRAVAVKKLPLEKRVSYLLRAVRPDDSLASTLLLALHLGHHVEMLQTFLDDLGIPNESGMIDERHEIRAPLPDRLSAATKNLFEKFDRQDVEIYLASLLAMDPDTWGALADLLK